MRTSLRDRSAFRCVLLLASCCVLTSACSASKPPGVAGEIIQADGSSTVYPITAAVAEEFIKANPQARLHVAFSGTTAGFEKFCRGETDIQNASRPIRSTEANTCGSNAVRFLEIPVAHDGLTVIVNANNVWAPSMTVAELRTLWEPAAKGKVSLWSHVRAGWPDRPIHLFGAGPQSGTFDYFTQAIVGTEDASRTDYTASEDDLVIVKGVAADELALGFVGYGYYEKHKDVLKAVAIDDQDDEIGAGAVLPAPDNVRRGLYRPLARPLFIYVNQRALERPEVSAFVDFYLTQDERIVQEVGCIAMNGREYELVRQRVSKRVAGSMFSAANTEPVSLEMLLSSAP